MPISCNEYKKRPFLSALDNEVATVLVLLDFLKAIDRVVHKPLCANLKYFGMTSTLNLLVVFESHATVSRTTKRRIGYWRRHFPEFLLYPFDMSRRISVKYIHMLPPLNEIIN